LPLEENKENDIRNFLKNSDYIFDDFRAYDRDDKDLEVLDYIVSSGTKFEDIPLIFPKGDDLNNPLLVSEITNYNDAKAGYIFKYKGNNAVLLGDKKIFVWKSDNGVYIRQRIDYRVLSAKFGRPRKVGYDYVLMIPTGEEYKLLKFSNAIHVLGIDKLTASLSSITWGDNKEKIEELLCDRLDSSKYENISILCREKLPELKDGPLGIPLLDAYINATKGKEFGEKLKSVIVDGTPVIKSGIDIDKLSNELRVTTLKLLGYSKAFKSVDKTSEAYSKDILDAWIATVIYDYTINKYCSNHFSDA